MKRLATLFYRGIPAKLFLINLLICMMVGIIGVAVIFSFRYMKNEMTAIFASELGHVIKNAQIGRELARVVADTNLLLSAFYGNEEFLKGEGERLIHKNDALMLKTKDDKLKAALDEFARKTQDVFDQCAAVNRTRRNLEGISQKIDHAAISLGDTVSEKIIKAITEGWEDSILNGLPLTISEYRETLLRINLKFMELGPEFFESPVEENRHPLLTLLDTLQMKVRPLFAYDSDIAAYGRTLSEDIRKYRNTILQFHTTARDLRSRLDRMNQEKEALLFRMVEIDRHIAKRAKQGSSALARQIMQGAQAGGVVMFAVIMAGVILAALLSRSITQSLNLVVARLRDIAEGDGDLTIRLEVKSKDELGEVARWFNVFIESLRQIIRDIAKKAGDLSAFAADMSSVSGLMSARTEEVSAKSTSVASSAEEMSVSIHTIASSAEEISVNIQGIFSTAEQMSNNMNSVAQAVREMSTAINDISENAREGAKVSTEALQMAKTATGTMNTLGDAVKEIGVVIQIIRKIAEDTNLLALNARIEAASAGNAGRGFAVVANEIKELANQSGQAAQDVARRIEEVQKHTRDAVRVIEEVSSIIKTINDSVGGITNSVTQQTQAGNEISSNVFQANTGVGNIASSIAEISEGVNDMSRNAGEVAKATNDVAADIQVVSEAADQSNAGARQVNASAVELARFAEHLEELVSKFKVV